MDQAFDAGLEFYKRAELQHAGDGATHAFARCVPGRDCVPGMRLQLLHADGNAAFVGIDFQNLGFDFLARGEDIGGLVDTAPADVADVEQRVHSTNVDEGAIARKAAHSAMHDVAFADFGVAAVLEGAFLFFRKHPAVDHDVFICDVELDDPAANFLTNQLFHLRGIASATARGGPEGPYPNINAKAAFDDAGHCAHNRGLLRESAFERRPVLGLLGAKTRELVVAFRITSLH